MSVYRRLDTAGLPVLITTNTAGRKRLFADEAAARSLVQVLYEVRRETGFRLLAFAVMPDHLHLVIQPSRNRALGDLVRLIKGRFARRHNAMSGGRGSLWQSRYHGRSLRSERELLAAVEYVHDNPVAGGLTSVADRFRWSSASGSYPVDLTSVLGQAEA